MSVTRQELISGLELLGLRAGQTIIVHSSLSSFGLLEGGATTLINSLQEILTNDGLLVMPTFTYGQEPFDRLNTPSKTGYVTEVFRTSPDVFRSEHPTHSVVVWGSRAEITISGHKTESAFGVSSPLNKIWPQSNILLVGVDFRSCSMIHVAQEFTNVSYLDRPKIVDIINPDGTTSSFKVRRAGCSLGFNKIENKIDNSYMKETTIGNSRLKFLPSCSILRAAKELLEENQQALFCDNSGCFSCNEARGMIK